MTTRPAKIIFRIILNSTFLSASHVKCSVWCNSFFSVRIKEKTRATAQPAVLVTGDCARGSDPESLRGGPGTSPAV